MPVNFDEEIIKAKNEVSRAYRAYKRIETVCNKLRDRYLELSIEYNTLDRYLAITDGRFKKLSPHGGRKSRKKRSKTNIRDIFARMNSVEKKVFLKEVTTETIKST